MDSIRKLTEKLKSQYYTNNPFDIAAAMDIEVISAELPHSIRGFCTKILGVQIIYINKGLSYQSKLIVCAHELGHILLHNQINTFYMKEKTYLKYAVYEKEADFFAACLLIDDEIFDYHSSGFSTFFEIANYTGFKEEVVEMRFNNRLNVTTA